MWTKVEVGQMGSVNREGNNTDTTEIRGNPKEWRKGNMKEKSQIKREKNVMWGTAPM